MSLTKWGVKPAQPPKKPTVMVTGELADEMQALEPGKVLTLGSRGRTFVIIDQDDFDHIAATGGMGLGKSDFK